MVIAPDWHNWTHVILFNAMVYRFTSQICSVASLCKYNLNWITATFICPHIVYGCLQATKAKLSSSDRFIWSKKTKIFTILPFTKKFANPWCMPSCECPYVICSLLMNIQVENGYP